MSNSYRIRTKVGVDKSIKVSLEQDFEFLEILSLKLLQSQVYQRKCSDYGVIIGRVTANNGFGVPNAKVSVFTPLTDQDSQNPIISELYPYRTVQDLNEDGYRYNLLPYTQSHSGHIPVGTFFSKEDVLTNRNYIEVFDKYYKYTALTNDSGDFMIFGVPVGDQLVHVDIDLSDIGEFSLSPQDLIRMGIATESQVAGNKFRQSTNLNELVQLLSFNRNVYVDPLWGEPEVCNLSINRLDFDLTSESNINITPTAIFMGSLISSSDDQFQRRNCKPKTAQGELCNLVAGPGQILAIRQTMNLDEKGRPILEVFDLEQGGQVIDDNGTWLVDLPMNMDYITTNEFGERVISNDPKVGIPTSAKYRFKIKWNQSPKLSEPIKRGYFLVPNIREYGWKLQDVDPIKDVLLISTQGDKELALKSYAFSLNWDDYADIQAAIDCEDTFYPFVFNKVYTVSQLIDQYRNGYLPNRIIAVRNILDQSCESTNVKFPTNDAVFRFDLIYILFTIMMFIFRPTLYLFLYVAHFLAWALKKLNSSLWRRLTNLQLPNLAYPECDLCECKVGGVTRGNGPSEAELGTAVLLDNNAFVTPFNLFNQYICVSQFATQQLLAGNQDYGTQNPNTQAPQLEEYTRRPSPIRDTFTTSIPIFERINLFNLKAKYFDYDGFNNPGGSWNRIGVNFRPSLNGSSNNPTVSYAQQYQNVVVNTGLFNIDIFNGSPDTALFPIPFPNQTVFPSIGPNPYNISFGPTIISRYIAPIAGLYEVTLNITCSNYVNSPSYTIAVASNLNGGNLDFDVVINNPAVSSYTLTQTFSLNQNEFIEVYGANISGFGIYSFDCEITMTVTAVSAPPSSGHMDLCNLLVVKPEQGSRLTAGTILSFQDPSLSKDPNLTGATLNQFGTNGITGTSINDTGTINVQWARPNGQGNNTTTYVINQNPNDAQYAKYPMDIEYFQVITAITINKFFQLCEPVPTAGDISYRNTNAASLRYRIFKSGIIRNVINTNNVESVFWDLDTPAFLSYENCFEDFGEQVIVFMVRGVDPYSSRGEVEYDLSRLFGYGLNSNGFPTGQVKVRGNNYKLNIPITNHYGCVRHNRLVNDVTSIDPIMAQGIYYESYHFRPNVSQFTGFTSDLPSYYSSLSAEYVNTPLYDYLTGAARVSDGSEEGALNANITMPGNYRYIKLKQVITGVYNNNRRYENCYNGFIITIDRNNTTLSSPRRYGYLYNNPTLYPLNQGFFPNEVVDGGSYMLQFFTVQNKRRDTGYIRATGYHYSPRYTNQQYNYNRCATTGRIVMRTDRLPTSTNLYDNLQNSFAWQANLTLGIFEIFDDSTFETLSGELVGSPTFNSTDQTTDEQVYSSSVLDTFTCSSMVPLGCYYSQNNEIAVRPTSNSCYENGIDGQSIMENGCYVLITDPFNSLSKDLRLLAEWTSRIQITFGACRNIWSHIFTNNWINGTLYAFSFKNDRFFTSPTTQPLSLANRPFSVYCTDTLVLHPTNNFYYRSSPYITGTTTPSKFVGAPRPIPSLFGEDYGGNRRNLKFPTTILDMGPRSQYIQELVFSDDYDGFVMDKLSETSYKDVSEILNLFIISRLVNESFLQRLIAGANILTFFDKRDKNFVDGDYTQLLGISSELGVTEFESINYPPIDNFQDPIYFNNANAEDAIIGIYFSSDTQTRDFITPKRTIINPFLSLGNECAFNYYNNFSQYVPFYQWQIKDNSSGESIFGSQRNDWYTQQLNLNSLTPNQSSQINTFFYHRYQTLDRLNSLSRYYRTANSSYSKDYKGYIYSVDYTQIGVPPINSTSPYLFEYETQWIPPTPDNQEPNRVFTVGAPFYFYFGLKKGKTAWDRFARKWLDLETFTD
jgi:hypothetical protein